MFGLILGHIPDMSDIMKIVFILSQQQRQKRFVCREEIFCHCLLEVNSDLGQSQSSVTTYSASERINLGLPVI